MKRNNVVLFGATGSIGTSTLKVLRDKKDRFRLFGFSVHKNIDRIKEIEQEFSPDFAVITSDIPYVEKSTLKILRGREGLTALAQHPDVYCVVIATSGTIGVYPTVTALEYGKRVCLANKETLVSFGKIVMKKAQISGELIPVDSEHSAIFQLLSQRKNETEEIILTASGGPFLRMPINRLKDITPEMALKHPTWNMGNKITIDSATLMNKGLEVIEAYHLFGLPLDKIKAVIHPQSIVHGLIKLKDGSYLAHLSAPDMRLPIQYALTFPDREPVNFRDLDIFNMEKLEFMKPDTKKFPLFKLAYEVIREGGTLPAVMNAANEVAVGYFLNKRIGFLDITSIVLHTVNRHKKSKGDTIEEIFEADRWAREEASKFAEHTG